MPVNYELLFVNFGVVIRPVFVMVEDLVSSTGSIAGQIHVHAVSV